VTARGKTIPFSLWPTKAGHKGRFKLQSTLFALDPWAIVTDTIRTSCSQVRRAEALACLDQARDFYQSSQGAGILEARPLTLYYSYMNLVKAFCLTRGTRQTFDKAGHGLSEQLHAGAPELTGAYLQAFPSPNPRSGTLQNFDEFRFALTGLRHTAQTDYDIAKLLPQIVPGHRLWAIAANKQERFVSVHDMRFMHDHAQRLVWLQLVLVAEDLSRLDVTRQRLLAQTGLPFTEVGISETFSSKRLLCFESAPQSYSGYPMDNLISVVAAIRPFIWTTVSTIAPYRRHYLYLCPPANAPTLLPQLLSIYAISYYLGSITRYRPHHYPKISEGAYGPRIQDFITGQPLQFLYLMASEFAKQDVTRPSIL
jgi:hypothetical protein